MRVDGLALHSPYDPAREAERFAESSLGPEPPSTVVILGEGLGYLTRWLADVHPAARVIRIYYSTGVFRSSLPIPSRHQQAWHPDLGTKVAEFLRGQISDLDVEGLRILEWPPSARLFPELSRAANEAVQQCLLELNGSLVTTMSMGRVWLRNSVFNFLSLDEVLEGAPCSSERTVVIVASGPSLESALPLLIDIRDAVDIWALPSSLPVLATAGLEPDLLFMTDPGYYAIHHLHHAVPACPVAMPLSAARGLWELTPRGSRPGPFLLAQPGILEEMFLRAMGVSAPLVAPHGTVAATALDLARVSTRGPVILAGLDMCTNDIVSHARPNEFEQFFLQRSSRTTPYYCFWYRRSADQNAIRVPGSDMARAPLSLRTYAGWLGRDEAAAGPRLYRLLPSPVFLAGMNPLDAQTLGELARSSAHPPRGPQLMRHAGLPSRPKRISLASRILAEWRGIIAEGRARAGGPEGHSALASAEVFAIAYQLATQSLLETRRKARLGDEKGARESAVALLDECEGFLRGLGERIKNAA